MLIQFHNKQWFLVLSLICLFIIFSGCGQQYNASPVASPITNPGAGINDLGSVPGLNGTFLEVDNYWVYWSQAQWTRELTWMKSMGMDTITLRASVYYNNSTSKYEAIYPTVVTNFTQIGAQPIEKILTAADSLGINVYLGLVQNEDKWFAGGTANLQEILTYDKSTASELYSLYRSHTSLKGIYLPQELDNDNWWTGSSGTTTLINNFLKPVTEYIKSVNPAWTITTAPYFETYAGALTSTQYAAWWRNVLNQTPKLDVIILQDGMSKTGRTSSNIADYFTAIRNVCTSEGRGFWSMVEVFNADGQGGEIPAPISRISQQIQTEKPLAQKLLSWEWMYDMDTTYSVPTADLYNNYERYLQGKGNLRNASNNKSYTLSRLPGNTFPDTLNGSRELTNGLFNCETNGQHVGWKGSSTISITLDLGSSISNIYQFRTYFFTSVNDYGAYAPASVKVYAMRTDINSAGYTCIGAMTSMGTEDNLIIPSRLTLTTPISARYIRFDITPGVPANNNYAWTILDEVGVYTSP